MSKMKKTECKICNKEFSGHTEKQVLNQLQIHTMFKHGLPKIPNSLKYKPAHK